jgi:type III restriction enzyme
MKKITIAVLKHLHTPLSLLGGQWEELRKEWEQNHDDERTPVLIIVGKNTNIAKCIYEWIAEDIKPGYLPSCSLTTLRNTETETNTIRVDSKVVEEIEYGR